MFLTVFFRRHAREFFNGRIKHGFGVESCAVGDIQYRIFFFLGSGQFLPGLFDPVFIDEIIVAQTEALVDDSGQVIVMNPQPKREFVECQVRIEKYLMTFLLFFLFFLGFILDRIFFPVICSFQGVNGWKLRKIVRDLPQAQKGNSYNKARDLAFQGHRKEAREMCTKILKTKPEYHDARILLGRLYAWDKDYDSDRNELHRVIQDRPGHLDARQLLERIQHTYQLFKMSLRYRYDHFERGERSCEPWHLFSFDLSNKMKWGSIIARVNYASRSFSSSAKSGIQFELDLYPRITKGFYAYLNGGYSSSSIFPKYRLGGELYKSLPFSFEISAGIRYLDFSSTQVYIYTGYLGKYYKNYWFSFRPFFTLKPSGVSFTGIWIVRRYLEDAENYIYTLILRIQQIFYKKY
jgi:YaiO family outer membrane protein